MNDIGTELTVSKGIRQNQIEIMIGLDRLGAMARRLVLGHLHGVLAWIEGTIAETANYERMHGILMVYLSQKGLRG